MNSIALFLCGLMFCIGCFLAISGHHTGSLAKCAGASLAFVAGSAAILLIRSQPETFSFTPFAWGAGAIFLGALGLVVLIVIELLRKGIPP